MLLWLFSPEGPWSSNPWEYAVHGADRFLVLARGAGVGLGAAAGDCEVATEEEADCLELGLSVARVTGIGVVSPKRLVESLAECPCEESESEGTGEKSLG